MPLLPPVLEAQLMALDTKNLDTAERTAQAWFDAWWAYAQTMTYLIPGGAGRPLVESSFKGILMGGLLPIPVPLTFFTMLGNAMASSWVKLGTPATLVPAATSITPPPLPFGPMGVAIAPVGLASSTKQPPIKMLTGLIHAWTITAQAVGPSGTIGPIN